jgi:putative ABC transport system ATP-binding protein
MIELEKVCFSYKDGPFSLAIERLSIAAGERIAFVGPSGSGKTTLLNLIAGISLPDTGRISTAGVEPGRLSDAERRKFRIRNIGLVFQEFELLDYLDVLDNILLSYRISAALNLNSEVRERAAALATELGIGDKLGRSPAALSQGERQRAAVCRALLPEPALLLADEPTGSLDPSNKGHVLNLLLDQATKRGATLLVVTHDHELLGRFDRVIDFRDFHHLEGSASGSVAGAGSDGRAP